MRKHILGLIVALAGFVGVAQASPVMPSFAGAPAGWNVDRYAPASFSDVGTYQGRSDVLGIGISTNDGYGSRPSGYNYTFYNTQGKSHPVSGGAGDTLSADLFVPRDWANPASGARRTDMWGVMTDGTTNVTGYPVIGFTNDGPEAPSSFIGFRTWDDTAGVWHDLANAVNYDGWNTLSILFTGSAYKYSINGVLADTIAADPSAKDFSSVIMQAYNFAGYPASGDLGEVVANDYTAHWSNTKSVPEPGTFALAGIAIIGLGATRRRKMAS